MKQKSKDLGEFSRRPEHGGSYDDSQVEGEAFQVTAIPRRQDRDVYMGESLAVPVGDGRYWFSFTGKYVQLELVFTMEEAIRASLTSDKAIAL